VEWYGGRGKKGARDKVTKRKRGKEGVSEVGDRAREGFTLIFLQGTPSS